MAQLVRCLLSMPGAWVPASPWTHTYVLNTWYVEARGLEKKFRVIFSYTGIWQPAYTWSQKTEEGSGLES